jgi:hypothetical protein
MSMPRNPEAYVVAHSCLKRQGASGRYQPQFASEEFAESNTRRTSKEYVLDECFMAVERLILAECDSATKHAHSS